ncbi:hypothetical protein [Arcobacter roscoffensis]|uniref:Organic solvent tolerance-like N-terminal domain-containing protein n=1 Tax=Arcobacter roscoffensis TaxID=2961520 RepID=A0ABY5E3S4_9BACT|nr:hypothetical protein [Arcobacter roscoffensis]UTJ05773.1 hypothetical protein NJU99_10975 [Arcobacter roscoffensis]
MKLLLLCFPLFLFAELKIVLNDIKEYKVTEDKIVYKISANSKNINPIKFNKFRFFNKEKIVSNSSFYLNGKFSIEDTKIDFTKAYFLEGKFVMLNPKGIYKRTTFKAQKAIYFKNKLTFSNVYITIKNKRYRKIKYVLEL